MWYILLGLLCFLFIFFFKQKTAYYMRISDWSSDVCSSDLFPEATDQRFADGYAQAVTFGFLMARAQNVSLKGGVGPVISALQASGSLIGSAKSRDRKSTRLNSSH